MLISGFTSVGSFQKILGFSGGGAHLPGKSRGKMIVQRHCPENRRSPIRPPLDISGLLAWVVVVLFCVAFWWWVGEALSKVENPVRRAFDQITGYVAGSF